MKNAIIVTAVLLIIATSVFGQKYETGNKTRYGVELSQFITGSGFASGTEVFVTVIPDHKKNLSLGFYFCPEQKAFTGVTIHHERTLVRYQRDRKIVPFAFYNMIYRITKIREVMAENGSEGSNGNYKSLEHHLGVGVGVSLAKNLVFKSAIGYGVYIGSIKKPSAPDAITGEIAGKNGFGAIAKIGIAYTF